MLRASALVLLVAVAACPSRGAGPVAVGPGEPAPAPVATTPPPTGLHLGDDVRPTSYELELTIDPSAPDFSGSVVIELAIERPVTAIWLNAADLTVKGAELRRDGIAPASRVVPGPPDSELIGVAVDAPLAPGPATLRLDYTGSYGTRVGLFRQSSGDVPYVYTDFEPTDARRAFPCFDEPRFKVPWRVTMVVPAELAAFSNTPELSSEPVGRGARRVRFAPTGPLPSYLVAVAVGPFDVVDAPAGPVPIRAIVPRGAGARARLALEYAPELLAVITDYVGTPSPYAKIDFISVPEMSGAMENPGLITVAERILLVDGDGTDAERRRLALVLAHELAHLWVGDWVTLQWWNDLWLNEGFATWMAARALRTWRPAWATEVDEVDDKARAIETDTGDEPRALRRPPRSYDDIRAAFDPITYQKGAAVLGMIESWIGADAFQAAVRRYVAAHADGNAQAEDLLRALEAESGAELAGLFHDFLERPGLPLVELKLDCATPRGAEIAIRQRPLVPVGAAAVAADAWRVPVCVHHPGGRACATELAPSVIALGPTCPAWYYPNADERGYYVFSVPRAELDALLAHARALPRTERAGLAHQLADLMETGVRTADGFEVLFAIAADPDHRVALVAIDELRAVAARAVPADARAGYAAAVRDRFGKRARALGVLRRPRDTEADIVLRPALLQLVGIDGDDAVLGAAATRRLRTWLDAGGDVDPELLAAVAAVAGHHGDDVLRAELVDELTDADGTRRAVIIHALGSFRDPDAIERTLELALAGRVPPAEAWQLFDTFMGNPLARAPAFAFFIAHYDAIANRIPAPLRRYLPLAATPLCTPDAITAAAALFARTTPPDDDGTYRATATRALTTARRCAAYHTAHADPARGIFAKTQDVAGQHPVGER